MTTPPFISICTPSYKRKDYIERLLNSLLEQTYTNFEVIITDNTPDDSISDTIKPYLKKLNIHYHKNDPPGNMASNWDRSIELARGEWIKILHDDDWLARKDSLQVFAEKAKQTSKKIIFCNYVTIEEGSAHQTFHKSASIEEIRSIAKNPYRFFVKNLIGPPSNMLIHNSLKEHKFDNRLIWLIDIDYYIRLAQKSDLEYIDNVLVNIGGNITQATKACFNNPVIEIPEALILYDKHKNKLTDTILLYDKWWRLMRNMQITTEKQIRQYAQGYPIPKFLINIVRTQQLIPRRLLNNGYISKMYMSISYAMFKQNIF